MAVDKSSVAPSVNIDLDTVQRPASATIEGVFSFAHNGRTIEMSSPHDLDFLEVATIESGVDFFRLLCSSEDRDYIRDAGIELWKFGVVVEAMLKHYKFDKNNLNKNVGL